MTIFDCFFCFFYKDKKETDKKNSIKNPKNNESQYIHPKKSENSQTRLEQTIAEFNRERAKQDNDTYNGVFLRN